MAHDEKEETGLAVRGDDTIVETAPTVVGEVVWAPTEAMLTERSGERLVLSFPGVGDHAEKRKAAKDVALKVFRRLWGLEDEMFVQTEEWTRGTGTYAVSESRCPPTMGGAFALIRRGAARTVLVACGVKLIEGAL